MITLLMSVRNESFHSSNIPRDTGGQVIVLAQPAVKPAAPINRLDPGHDQSTVASNPLKFVSLVTN